MPPTPTPRAAGRSALRTLAAKATLVAECNRLGIPLRRPAWRRTIDLAIPRWGLYSKALWNDYVDALLKLAGVPAISGLVRDSPASAIEWLTRPKGERAALVAAAWGRAGWSESPAGSNKVAELRVVCERLGLSAWYAAMGWAWCDFVAHLAGLVVGSTACAAGVGPKHRYNGLYTPDSLAVAQQGRYGWKAVPKTSISLGVKLWIDFGGGNPNSVDHAAWALGKPGQACYGLEPTRDEVVTAEGNTSGEGETGSQSNGGRLAIRKRPLWIVAGAAIPAE